MTIPLTIKIKETGKLLTLILNICVYNFPLAFYSLHILMEDWQLCYILHFQWMRGGGSALYQEG